ncbi:MAG: hypothetical protein QM754_18035 [Tepidisphaeraceae bacterium]
MALPLKIQQSVGQLSTAVLPDDITTLLWYPTPSGSEAFVNVAKVIPHGQKYSAYVLVRIFSVTDQNTFATFGTRQPMRVWMNQQPLEAAAASGSGTPGMPIHLQAGWNTLLVRVSGDGDQCTFGLRLSDKPTPSSDNRFKKGTP